MTNLFENKNQEHTPLSDIGEFGLLDRLTKDITTKNTSTIKGIGDDAAILGFKNDKKTVISTDLLVEGVHFDLAYMPLKHLGYKAVIVNLSDIYAMNAHATHITVSLALSNRFPLEAVEELYSGIRLAADRYGVDIIGGDTTSSNKGLIISITAIGEVSEQKITYRRGAKPMELIVVSGDLGGAYLGLQVLERERQVFEVNPNNQPDIEMYSYLIERQLKPEARKDIPPLLEDLGVLPTAMIDISDGLSSEILHLCKSSDVGCNIYEEKIPMDPQVITTCEEFSMNPTTVTLNGGEDYELLFTISQDDYPKIKGNPDFTVIGHITTDKTPVLVSRAGDHIPLTALGWDGLK